MKLGKTGNNALLENGKTLDPGMECFEDDASWLLSRKKPLVEIWKEGKDGDQIERPRKGIKAE